MPKRVVVVAGCKKCSQCSLNKPLSEFYSGNPGTTLGYSSKCKECERARSTAYRLANPEKRRLLDNGKKKKARAKVLRSTKPAVYLERTRQWRKKNPEKQSILSIRADRKRRATPHGRLNASIGSAIRRGLASGSKRRRPKFELLGYTLEQLKHSLEAQFANGMCWENYGAVWHIDHIIPLSAHNFSTPDDIDFRRAWALSNLRPLWAVENISKGAKLSAPFQPSLALSANDNQPGAKNAKAS